MQQTKATIALLTEKLRAIENAYSVNGVNRIASEIQTSENWRCSRAGTEVGACA